MTASGAAFDPAAKEREIRADADSWDVSAVASADDGDVSVVDVGPYFASGVEADLRAPADVLRTALETAPIGRTASPRRSFRQRPHVDTTFITLPLPGGPGLTIYSHPRGEWITVPVLDGAYVVNAGAVLLQRHLRLPDGLLPVVSRTGQPTPVSALLLPGESGGRPGGISPSSLV